jgi:N-formylglutamate amidohydrolase
MLRRAEDAYVDQLYDVAPVHGATLIAALFPRSYIDANRAEDDVDPAILMRPPPPSLKPRPVSRVGLVRRHARPGIPIYDGKLDPEDVLARIERYHRPYHRVLEDSVDALHSAFGAVWHINCHSMPSYGNRSLGRRGEHGDFVLGDRDGTTCERDFTDFVARFLRGAGYDVRINEGYKGVEIVRRQGRPAANRHSLQIEVDRSLYMDQKTLEKLPGFGRLRADLAALVEAVAGYVRSRL